MSDEERHLIVAALGSLPLEPSCGTLNVLWQRFQRGEVQMRVLPGTDQALDAVTVFQTENFCDGSKNFVSLCTVALGKPTDTRLAHTDMPAMERLARSLGCQSMSMRTIRPGLVKVLCEEHGWFPSEIILRKRLI